MSDPITVGSLVALAVSTAVQELTKGIAADATKVAYNALKEALSTTAGSEVEALEKAPNSTGRQMVLAELVNAQSKNEKKSLRELAEALAAAMNQDVTFDEEGAKWKGTLHERTKHSFTILFSRGTETHRVEARYHKSFFGYNNVIIVDGIGVDGFDWPGRKSFSFYAGNTKFVLKLACSFSGEYGDVELWADSQLALRFE